MKKTQLTLIILIITLTQYRSSQEQILWNNKHLFYCFFLFHGVVGGHDINVKLKAHRQLIHFLKQHENEIWNDTMINVAKYIKHNQTLK